MDALLQCGCASKIYGRSNGSANITDISSERLWYNIVFEAISIRESFFHKAQITELSSAHSLIRSQIEHMSELFFNSMERPWKTYDIFLSRSSSITRDLSIESLLSPWSPPNPVPRPDDSDLVPLNGLNPLNLWWFIDTSLRGLPPCTFLKFSSLDQ